LLPFYIVTFAIHGREFIDGHLGFNLLDRAAGRLNVSAYPWYFYFQHILRSDAIGTALWIALGTVGALGMAIARRDRALFIFATLSLGGLAVMSAIGTRLPHYILFVYPAAALGAAGVYHHLTRARAVHWSVLRLAIAPLLALVLLTLNLRVIGGDQFLMQTAAAKVLGTAAGRVLREGEPVYAYEWYGQGLSFYAEHDVVLLTEMPSRHRLINIEHFKRAGAAKLVPPPPAPVGTEIVVAGRKPDLDRARWLEVTEPIALSDGVFLVRARIVPSGHARAARPR
jgi:hypothetical protein